MAIETGFVSGDVKIGESIAVNGVCLSLIKKDSRCLYFEVIPETLKLTNLGRLRIAERVNLERSLKITDRLSGHFVSGHVDCLGIIRKKNYFCGSFVLQINIPLQFMKYCLPRGSIALDGISLTLAESRGSTISVYLIPHTLKNTTLGFKGPSDRVNVEFDLLAKSTAQNHCYA